MTYFGFLAIFLLPPLILLMIVTQIDRKRRKYLPDYLSAIPFKRVVAAHILVALIYTTPWDNYLVATKVWWYNPELVTGITIGWVPIEEYTFFILQTWMTGLWIGVLARNLYRYNPPKSLISVRQSKITRLGTTSAIFVGWIWSLVVLMIGWQPGTYLALILVWALPPVMLQTFFGGDILWKYKKLVLTGIASATLYLAAADSVAISAETWTINPAQTLGILLGGILPIEEFIFFLMTNLLITFGITLVIAKDSQQRVPKGIYSRIGLLIGFDKIRDNS